MGKNAALFLLLRAVFALVFLLVPKIVSHFQPQPKPPTYPVVTAFRCCGAVIVYPQKPAKRRWVYRVSTKDFPDGQASHLPAEGDRRDREGARDEGGCTSPASAHLSSSNLCRQCVHLFVHPRISFWDPLSLPGSRSPCCLLRGDPGRFALDVLWYTL